MELQADSDDYVTEVVDVTGGSDDEDLVEVKAGQPPVFFHGYRRGRELGRGASGQVFVCHKKGSEGGGFAVKAVDLRRLQLQPNAEREEKKLSREVEILKRLPPHPHIVQLIDTFEEGDWFLLVLELVGGGDLYTVLTNREPPRLQEREAAFVLSQLAEGLAFLHSQGIIHRDCKLENVLVAAERRERPLVFYTVKITDFGLSKTVGAGFSEARSTVGTRPYTAPEVLREDLHDFSSDVWCLGVLLFVLLAGHFPFSKIPTAQEQLKPIVDKLKVSEAGKSVVLSLLQLEPRQRVDLPTLSRSEWVCGEADESDRSASVDKSKRGRSLPISPSLRPLATAPSTLPLLNSSTKASFGSEDAPDACGIHLLPEASAADLEAAKVGAQETSPGLPQPPEKPHLAQSAGTAVTKRSISLITAGEVSPASLQPDVMQVHMVVPDRLAAFVNKNGPQLKQIATTVGCQFRMISRKGVNDNRVVIIGNYNQCVIVQELVHARLTDALRSEGQEPPAETGVVVLVRAEAAGMIIGKQGWMLRQIKKQSNTKMQILREEIRGQRPCIIEGELQNILKAEKHVFDLVGAVPVAIPSAEQKWRSHTAGPNLRRTRVSTEPLAGKIVNWKGQVGWIEPDTVIDHPKAASHHGHIYVHVKDVVTGEALPAGQLVRFQVYEDRAGLGAEQCQSY